MGLKWDEIEAIRAQVPLKHRPWDWPDAGPGPRYNVMMDDAMPALDSDIELELRDPEPDTVIARDAMAVVPDLAMPAISAPRPPVIAQDSGADRAPPAPVTRRATDGAPPPPAPTGAAQIDTDRAAISETTLDARKLEQTLLNLSRGDGDVTERTGYRALGGTRAAGALVNADERKREEESRDSAFRNAMKTLENYLARLDAEIAAVQAQIEEIDRKIEAIDELTALERTGQLDPNNPAHQRLLRRAGISDEEARRGDLATILAQRRGEYVEDRNTLMRDLEDKLEKRAMYAPVAEAAQSRPDDPQVRADVFRAVETLEGARQLSRTAALTSDMRVKTLVADAIVETERDEVRADSANYNHNAVADVGRVLDDSGADFDFNVPPGGGTQLSAADQVGPTPIEVEPLTPIFASVNGTEIPAPVLALDEERNPMLAAPPSAPVRLG